MDRNVTAKVGQLEGGIAAAIASAHRPGSTGAGGGGSRQIPLDQDRRFEHMKAIDGSENVSVIVEWRRKLEIFIEAAIPGAKAELEWARQEELIISTAEIEQRVNKPVAYRLNAELYTLMMGKMSGRADGALRSVDSRQGLEAWRMVWKFLGNKDRQALRMEYRKLNAPAQIKKISDITFFLTIWETRMSELAAANPAEYTLGPQQRISVLKEVMPAELRSRVNNAEAMGDLNTWAELRDYCIHQSQIALGMETSNAMDVSINAVEQDFFPDQQQPRPQSSN